MTATTGAESRRVVGARGDATDERRARAMTRRARHNCTRRIEKKKELN